MGMHLVDIKDTEGLALGVLLGIPIVLMGFYFALQLIVG